MADLANVWVRAARLELIRADRIVSLSIGNPAGDGPAQVTVLPGLRSEQPGGGMLPVMASVADGAEPREVHLRSYEVGDAVPALAGLADALVAAAARSEADVVRVPGHGRRGSLGDHDGTAARVDRVRPAPRTGRTS